MSRKLEITIIRSRRKSIAVQIKRDMQIVVRAPYRTPEREIFRFVEEKRDWIENHLDRIEREQESAAMHPVQHLSKEELEALADQAMEKIPERVRYYAPIVGVKYGRITIRNQKTRWGSCSSQGNLNFNCLLMLAPQEVIDYVVIHELCHRLEMNHSAKFWAEVERVMPGYRKPKYWLKEHGTELMARNPKR